MRIQINPEKDRFLLDHVVDGAPVLPTVMQLDLVARALRAVGHEHSAGLLLRDVTVGPPVRFGQPGGRDLDLLCTPEPSHRPAPPAWRCELRSPGHDAPHLAAVAGHAAGPQPWVPPPGEWADCLHCGPDLVYPPFFHGPAFQVVSAFGRTDGGLRAALAPDLPPLSWGCGPTLLRPRLLELLLQSCGLQVLAETGRMTVPAGLDAVHWHPASLGADDGTRALAVTRPRPGPANSGLVFDGQVMTPAGEVLVMVTGYRTAGLGQAADLRQAAHLANAARLRRCLASNPEPAHVHSPNLRLRRSTTMTAPATTPADTAPAPRLPHRGYPDTAAFRGFFAPSRIEADVYDLEVDGEIPPGLNGAFYRAAADTQFPPRREDDIYINGDGMITMIRFGQGHADLRTRYVRTQRFRLERAARQALFGAYRNPFTDDPAVRGVDDGSANTSVVWHAGRLLALKEAALPYELDPVTLQTRGVFSFDGQLPGRTFTAHPKIDPVTGEMIAFSYNASGRPDRDINLFVISPAGQLTRTETFQAPYSSMMHDWLVTRDYMIFTFSPMISDWERMKDEPQYFVWDPPQGTHVAVVPREEGVAGIRWFASDLVMETHSLNAWSAGDTVVADHFVARSGWFSQFPKTTQGLLREAPPFAQRWTLNVRQGAAHWSDSDATYTVEPLFDHPGDMPRVDPRVLMDRNRHSWIGCMNPAAGPMPEFGPMGPPFNSLFHRDDDTGKQAGYYVGEDSAPEEPVFVPKGPDAAEGEGYLLALVGRRALNRNDMIILDALDIAAGPIATLKIPFRLRYGFHGTWIPAGELDHA